MTNKWKKIYFNQQNIAYETDKATLIKMPKTDYCFWHPSKLVRSEGKYMSFVYTDDFDFKAIKQNKRKDTIGITVDELESYFADMNENISGRTENDDSYLIVEKPAPIEVKGVVPDCLKNS